MTCIRPYSGAKLRELRETFARVPLESVTDYVCRVVDNRADSIILCRDEVKGCSWGPEVFLGAGPKGDYALSSRIFYWAGSLDPMDRQEPTEVNVSDSAELTEAIKKLVCVQAVYQRGLYPYPLDAPIDPQRLKPLVRSLPAPLKGVCDAKREQIEWALDLDNHMGDTLPHHTMWEELLEELSAKGRDLGYSSPAPSPAPSHEKWQLGNKGSHVAAPRGKQEVRHAKASQSAFPGGPGSPSGSPRASPRGSPRGSPQLSHRFTGKPKGQNPYYRQSAYQTQSTQYGIKPRDIPRGGWGDISRAEFENLSRTVGELWDKYYKVDDMHQMMQRLMDHTFKNRGGDEAGRDRNRSPRASSSPNEPEHPFISGQHGAICKQKNPEPFIMIPTEPDRAAVKYLIDTGAQITVLNVQLAKRLRLLPSRKKVKITGVTGQPDICHLAKTRLWLPGDEWSTIVEVALGSCPENILGFDVLSGGGGGWETSWEAPW
ncbi:uncharacterized protein LOC135192273 [Pogoniulus pusillus]|uniref:uncharacterized protein LOC135192273 n=1 Tax=Pogoniulus pusillus TaxID=488313 RepID=UPI0030B98A79